MRKRFALIVLTAVIALPVGTAQAGGPTSGFVLTATYRFINIAGPAVNGREVPPNADIGPPLVFHDQRINSPRGWNLGIKIADRTGGAVFSIADIGPTTEVPFCTSTRQPILVPPHTTEIEVALYDGTCEGSALSLVTTGSVTLTFTPG